MFKRFSLALTLACAAIGFATPAQAQFAAYSAVLTGLGEVPPVPTLGVGVAGFTVLGENQAIAFVVATQGLGEIVDIDLEVGGPTDADGIWIANLYQANSFPPTPGTLIISFGPYSVGILLPTSLGNGATIADVVAAFESSNAFVNVETAAYPDGEIRGQVGPAPVGAPPRPSASSSSTTGPKRSPTSRGRGR